MYLIAPLCGLPTVWHWRRDGIPPWRGMGLSVDSRAWAGLAADRALRFLPSAADAPYRSRPVGGSPSSHPLRALFRIVQQL